MSPLPDVPADRPDALAERRVSSEEFEAVIRRAAELQARSAEEGGGEGMTEGELVRIGKELGLSDTHLTRALAEVRGAAPPETGALARSFGPAVVQASRLVPRPAEEVRRELERYLLERECMVVQRRLADRVVYEEASGAVAALNRAARRVSSRQPLLGLKGLEAAVRAVDAGSCFVALSTSLRAEQVGLAVGGTALGGAAGGTTAAVLAIALHFPPAALLGLPLLLGGVFGARAVYRHQASRRQVQLESLLDRLEHRELVIDPIAPGWRERLGI